MLEKREYVSQILKEHTMVNFRVDFVPSTLNDQEVYEVKNEHGHYCYMTPEMVDKIFELKPGSKDRYVDQFYFASEYSKKNFVRLKNKIVLDLPDNVDAKSFSANGFGSMSFSFVHYTEDVKKEPVVLKVQRKYNINGIGEDGGTIELIFPDNKMECNEFGLYS